jgi:O-methyltransferase involved in polyketide biosynthesis
MTAVRIALNSRNVVAETLFIPLYIRALEMREPRPLLIDESAVALVERLDYDFKRIKLRKMNRVGIVMRAHRIDLWTRDFLAANPGATVVHIGCGLDTRFERVDDGRADWYDLDLPEVIALRRELLPERPRGHLLACSVFDPAWIEAVTPSGRPALFIAEGVLPYFEESQVKALILMLRRHFPGAELICDAFTPFMVRLDNLILIRTKFSARLRWGIKRGRDMERWAPGIALLNEWFYFDEPEPRMGASRWMRYFPPFGRGVGLFHYRL